jgi:transcriptional regulator with GAF, ATPase, and Fis domain
MVAGREFRSDLFYRLNVFPIRIPSLRERKEDIPLLVSYFVQKFAKQMQKQIESVPSAVMKGLTAWEWPGNIRELENFIERAVILTRGKVLEVPLTELRRTETEMAVDAVVTKKRAARKAFSSGSDINAGAEEYERKQREEIIQALTARKGRVGGTDGAAIRLGTSRTTLIYRMRRLGIYSEAVFLKSVCAAPGDHLVGTLCRITERTGYIGTLLVRADFRVVRGLESPDRSIPDHNP